MNVLTVCLINQVVAITIGVFVNILLMFLICCCSTKNLRSYARILKLHCLSDLFYILILQITSLRTVSHEKSLIILITGPFSNLPYAYLLSTLSVFGFMLELIFIQLDYYYRYILVCKNNVFSNTRFGVCVLIAIIVSGIQTCISFYAMDFGPSPDPTIKKFWKIARDALDIKHKKYPFGVVNGESPRMWVSETSCMLVILAVYSIVGFSTYKIRQTLKENDRRHTKKGESKRTAAQITNVMILSAVSPFISFALPAILVTIASFINFNNKFLGIFMTLNLYWSPTIKAIGTIYIVSPYRRAIIKKLLPRWAPPPSVTTNSKDDSLARTQSQPLPAVSSISNMSSNNQIFL